MKFNIINFIITVQPRFLISVRAQVHVSALLLFVSIDISFHLDLLSLWKTLIHTQSSVLGMIVCHFEVLDHERFLQGGLLLVIIDPKKESSQGGDVGHHLAALTRSYKKYNVSDEVLFLASKRLHLSA